MPTLRMPSSISFHIWLGVCLMIGLYKLRVILEIHSLDITFGEVIVFL